MVLHYEQLVDIVYLLDWLYQLPLLPLENQAFLRYRKPFYQHHQPYEQQYEQQYEQHYQQQQQQDYAISHHQHFLPQTQNHVWKEQQQQAQEFHEHLNLTWIDHYLF
jgi:hypothetical protein